MTRSRAAVVSALVVAVMLAIGVWQVRPPAPADERAPADEFSAARAMTHIEAIAAEPRPIGSAAHGAARDYLLSALREAGFTVSLQRATVPADGDARTVASIDNVVGVLPGRDRSLPVVILVAHYDSVAMSPGAADNASGVAVVLETARALAAAADAGAGGATADAAGGDATADADAGDATTDAGAGRLPGDVVVLLTDAEEVRLLGARAFLQDAVAPRVGAVLNFDNAGSSGPSVMYQTSEGNARLVDAFAETERPLGSSLIDELARRGRVQSDFTPLREAGLPTMTFGLSEGFVRNHTALDTVDRIAAGSLQQQGEQALSAVRATSRAIAAARLATDGERDVVYFPVSRRTLVVYARDWVLPLAVAVAVLYAAVLAFGLLRRDLDPFSLLSGAANSLLTLVFMSAVTAALWGFGWAGAEGGDASNPPYASDLLHRAGLTLVLVAVGLALYLWALDREHAIEATLGAALWWLVLVFYVSFALPGGSYLLVWPLAAVLASLLIVLVRRWPAPHAERLAWPGLLVLWVGVLPALVLFGSSIYLLFTVSEMRLVVVLLTTWLLLGALLPELALLGRRARRAAPAACAAVGLAIVVGLSPATGLADDPPPPVQAVYLYDATARGGSWGDFSPDGDLSMLRELVWREVRIDDRSRVADAAVWGEGPPPAVALPPPRVEVVADRRDGERRHLTLRLLPASEAAVLSLFVDSEVGELAATADGLPLSGGETRWLDSSTSHWHLDWFAPRAEGLSVELEIDAGRPLLLRLAQLDRGLPDAPALQAPARRAGLGPAGVADATVVQSSYVLGRRVGAALVERPLPADE